MDVASQLTFWGPAIMIVFMLSFLHSENPLYRLVENIYVGAGSGHYIVIGIGYINSNGVQPMLKGNVIYAVPIALGLMMFATLSKRYYWTTSYPVSLLVGVALGLTLRALPAAQIFGQIAPTIAIVTNDAFSTIGNIILWLAAFTTITYFLYTIEVKGRLAAFPRLGRYFMMIAFGAVFGGVVLTRLVTLVSTLQFVLSSDAVAGSIVAFVLVVVVLLHSWTQRRKADKQTVRTSV